MTADSFVALIRITWLTLCGMMLFSRVAFQWAGPVRMRAFLEGWKVSLTHRLWGASALLWGLGLVLAGFPVRARLSPMDIVLSLLLIGVLMADGMLNVLPSSFSQFKEQMQAAWVRRHHDTARSGDRTLFGTVNVFLGLAAVSMAAVVIVYRPIQEWELILGPCVACLLTAGLISLSLCERRKLP